MTPSSRHSGRWQRARLDRKKRLVSEVDADLWQAVLALARQSGLGLDALLARLVGGGWRSLSGSDDILENISDAFLRIDRQWRFVYLNTHSERLLQRPRRELLGRNVWEEFPEAVASRFQREFVQAMETGVPAWFEEYYAPLETWFSVRAYPDSEGLSIHFQDINERRRFEESLREHSERLSLALESAKIGLWDWDLQTGHIHWSYYHETIFGYVPGSPARCYEDWASRVHPEDLPQVEAAVREAMVAREDFAEQYRVVWPDGSLRWVWAVGRFHYDSQGRPVRMLGTVQDISERKHILARMSELQALSRLKDDFLSTVSHELRSPLTNMRLAIRALETVDDPERRRQYLEILRGQCDREVDLVNDLLDLQAAESGLLTLRIEPLFLDPWLFNLVAPFRDRAEQNTQQLSVHLDPALDRVVSDQRRLERIVSELVHNACKYTPPGGHIQIEATRRDTWMAMCVRNAPAMIPPELLERIFEKFYRIPEHDPRHSGGSGLGLALVRELAARLGGTVVARSTEGTTEFVLTLPLAGPPDPA